VIGGDGLKSPHRNRHVNVVDKEIERDRELTKGNENQSEAAKMREN
jgi:hypothetical protein